MNDDHKSDWYLSHGDGKPLGPFAWKEVIEQAKAGSFGSETMVYHQEKTNGEWIEAQRVNAIAEATKVAQPPPVPPVSPPKIVENQENKFTASCPHCRIDLLIHRTQAGQIIDCPKCSGKFQAPVPAALPPGGGVLEPTAAAASELTKEQFVAKKIPAGICAIILGGLGVHKFILGFSTAGTIVLVGNLCCIVSAGCLVFPIFGSLIFYVIGVIEGATYLSKTDDEFYQLYHVEKKEWF